MAQRFRPDKALGWTGDILYDLRTGDGRAKPWTVEIARDGARARPGRPTDPKLTLRVGLADFVRIAGRDLEPGRALLTGRMEIEGDVVVATRLGEMFGEPSPY
jgi:putative sterol carrier protein